MNKIKELRKKRGYSQKELADILFVNQTAVSQWERGATSPNQSTLIKLSELLGVSTDYLLGVSDEKDDLSSLPSNVFKIVKKRIPLLGTIAAGVPIYADEDRESYVEVGADMQADFCLKTKGDSMIGAGIDDGDIVFIKKQDMVNNGQIAAVLVEDEATLKTVYFKNGSIMLVAANPEYEPIIIGENDCLNVRILGKAIALQRDIN